MNRPIRTLVATAAAFTILVAGTPSVWARERGEIRFSRGRFTKTVGATVRPGDPDCWTIGTGVGQRLRASVSGRRGVWLVYEPQESDFSYDTLQDQINDEGDTFHREETYSSGEKVISVGTTDGRTANYRLTLDIR